MILTDAGPLLALLDADDEHHATCMGLVRRLPRTPLLTTWPCFTEAMYLLGQTGGWHFRSALWNLRSEGRVVLTDLSRTETDRAAGLMAKYSDVPMDLGDASLVAVAETRSIRRVFTLDHHFRIYRLANGSVLESVPG